MLKKLVFYQHFYYCVVNVIRRRALISFYENHADAKNPLETWYRVCKKAAWNSFNEVLEEYPTADVAGDDRVVFNIKENRYRLVARFSFRYQAIQVKWIGTHAAYAKIDVLEI